MALEPDPHQATVARKNSPLTGRNLLNITSLIWGGGDTPDGWLVKEEEKEERRGRGHNRHIYHIWKHINYTEESKVELSGSQWRCGDS